MEKKLFSKFVLHGPKPKSLVQAPYSKPTNGVRLDVEIFLPKARPEILKRKSVKCFNKRCESYLWKIIFALLLALFLVCIFLRKKFADKRRNGRSKVEPYTMELEKWKVTPALNLSLLLFWKQSPEFPFLPESYLLEPDYFDINFLSIQMQRGGLYSSCFEVFHTWVFELYLWT